MAVGVAVLGLDHWYTAFGVLDICSASETTPLIAIYDADAGRRAEVAAAYPKAIVTDDPAVALSQPGVSLAAVLARTGDAVPLTKQALLTGKDVLSVKPFARNTAEADELLAVAAASGRFFGSFEGMQRLHPRAEKLRELIQGGAIGDVIAFHQVGHGGLPAPWRNAASGEPSWWLDPEQVPGGAWIDHSIYAVDLARFVLGGEVVATTGVRDNRVHKSLAVEDYGAALMTLRPANGPDVTMSITDTWCAESGGYGEYRFLGTHGTITADGYNTWVVSARGQSTRHEVEGGQYFRIDRFGELLERGEPIPFGPADALANLAACLEFYA